MPKSNNKRKDGTQVNGSGRKPRELANNVAGNLVGSFYAIKTSGLAAIKSFFSGFKARDEYVKPEFTREQTRRLRRGDYMDKRGLICIGGRYS